MGTEAEVDLLVPHGLRRWVLPLGALGLVGLVAVTMALPRAEGATFFVIARLGFVAAYLGLVAVGFSRSRRKVSVRADASGLYVDGVLEVPRAQIAQVVVSQGQGTTTIEIRGPRPRGLELASPTLAAQLAEALAPGRDQATLTVLATTTPTYLVVLAWVWIPGLLAYPAQLLIVRHAPTSTLVVCAIPAAVLWLGASWWFMRRRRVTVSTTEVALPRLFGGRDRVISLGELTSVAMPDAFTLVLRFASRRPTTIMIYDPALASDLADRLAQRARIAVQRSPSR